MAGAVGPLPVKVNFSGIDLFEPADAPRKGAFSGAAGTDNGNNFSFLDGKRNIPEHGEAAEGFVKASHLNCGLRSGRI